MLAVLILSHRKLQGINARLSANSFSFNQISNSATTMESNIIEDTRSRSDLAETDMDGEDSPFLINKYDKKRTFPSLWYLLPWLLALSFASLFVKERSLECRGVTSLDTFAGGFATEFGKFVPVQSQRYSDHELTKFHLYNQNLYCHPLRLRKSDSRAA